MMFDDAGFERNDKVTGREPAQRRDKPAEPLYDREVPLAGTTANEVGAKLSIVTGSAPFIAVKEVCRVADN